MDEAILSFHNVTKMFPGVRALDNVSMQFRKGEIHAIVGENGAGKSTLIKILAGAYPPTEGTIRVLGDTFSAHSHYTPHESLAMGISVIYQEFNLIPYLSVAENVFYGRETTRSGLIDRKAMEGETRRLCREMGIELDPRTKVKDLSVAYQQIVEIVKSLSRNAKIVVMDEPTAPLTNKEIESLFGIVRKMKAKGVTVLYISHRLEEVFEICDRVSVMRDGKYVTTKETRGVSIRELIGFMIGRELSQDYPQAAGRTTEVVLAVRGLTTEKIKDVSFELHKGEILGLGGLVGSGRSETVRALFGADRLKSGEITILGENCRISSPADAIQHSLGLLPEDRKRHGLVIGMQVKENITYGILKALSRFGLVSAAEQKRISLKLKDSLRIKTPKITQITRNLSGGNQQKVVLAKWLATKCDILIFDEPTRGIDVGTKQEIYGLMRDLTRQGKSILMISSEMLELIGMSDRILIMHEGRVNGVLARDGFSQERILEIASGTNANIEANR
ncbi:MAG: sugar ABC transporter ATP-binding protein [Spirochaetia bacterium]|jgi:ribose transport system ATP-binding protein